MRLTIGFDGKFLPRNAGSGSMSGNGVHARELLSHLLSMDRENRYRVYLPMRSADDRLPEGCDPVRLPGYARSSMLRNVFAYRAELSRRPVDVLLCFYHVPLGTRCRTVLLLPDVFWVAHPEWLPWWMAFPRAVSVRRSVAAADRIVTTTRFSRDEIVRLFGVPESRIAIVPHGVRADFRERMPQQRIEAVKEKIGTGAEYVLSVNDIHPRKNLVGLVEAFSSLKSRTGLPHRLVVAGRTLWRYPEFFDAVERSRWRSDIVLAGYVDAQDVIPLYQGASLFVYPSYYEGWGLQVHEAMSAGVPLAIANNTTMPEISGGAAGEFDPYDVEEMAQCMIRILGDADLRASMVRRGLEEVMKYSWEAAARRTLDVCLAA